MDTIREQGCKKLCSAKRYPILEGVGHISVAAGQSYCAAAVVEMIGQVIARGIMLPDQTQTRR
jgi:hypothetical protein